MKKSKGFTLIELLVVITIIAILAISIFVALRRARASARDSQRRSFCRDVVTAQELYYQKHQKYGRMNKLKDEGFVSQIPKICPESSATTCGLSQWNTWNISGAGSTWFRIKAKMELSGKWFYCGTSGCKEE